MMRVNMKKIPPAVMRFFRRIGRAADRDGLRAYLVGGCVRDLVLGRENLDWDIVLEHDALVLARRLARELKVKVTAYPQFGTATLFLPRGRQIDLATTRSERYVRPGALPAVRKGTLRQDLFRRDFTINTLAMSLNAGCFGQITDLFGGMRDLKAKKVRVLHDNSFIDDPTRILRAVRFEQRFGFSLGRVSRCLLTAALKRKAETTVHPGRLFEEFRKMFKEPFPGRAIIRLQRLGGCASLFPEMKISTSVLRALDRSRPGKGDDAGRKSLRYLMGVFWAADREQIMAAARRLRLTRQEKDTLLALDRARALRRALARTGLSPSRVFTLTAGIPDDVLDFLRMMSRSRRLKKNLTRCLKKSRTVRLAVGGEDVLKTGVSGRKVGEILQTVLLEKIDGRTGGRRAELARVRCLAGAKE